MKEIRIEKLTLNVGTGSDQARLEKGMALLQEITGTMPVKTFAKKRIPNWGLRPGLPIGCKLTLRKKKAMELLPRLMEARSNMLKTSQVDSRGNVAFGIPEYIEIKGVPYNPKIGIMGLEVCITMERPGFRIKRRKIMARRIPKRHQIGKEEAMAFMKKNFKAGFEEE